MKTKGGRFLRPLKALFLPVQGLSGMSRISHNGRLPTLDAFRCQNHLLDGQIRGNLEHDVRHDFLQNCPQASGTDLAVNGLLGNGLHGILGDLQSHAVHLQQLLILADNGVLGLYHNANQVLLAKTLQAGDHGHTANELRDNAELHQIVGLHLGKQLAHIPILPAFHRRIKADGAPVRPGLNDLIQPIKGTAADEEDIGGIYLDHLLLGVLPSALGRDIGNGALQDFQQRLLHALAGHIPGNGGILALAGDFVHFIDVNNAPLGQLHVKIRSLQEAKQNVLHIVAHIAGLGQRGSVCDCKGHVENLGQSLCKEGLAAARGADEQNIALLQIHIGIVRERNALIVIVDRNGQGDLGLFLTNDIVVHEGLHFHGGRQLFQLGGTAARIDLIPQQLAAVKNLIRQ